MEKTDKGSERSELDDSSDVELVEDEPPKQEDPHSQMQDQIAAEVRAETRNEMSIGLQDGVNYESGGILQPKGVKRAEQCGESMQNRPEVLMESPGMEYEAVACRKQGTVQKTTKTTEGEAATDVTRRAEHAESSKVAKESIAIEGNEEFPKRIEGQENVPKAERDLEVGSIAQGEQLEQALQVRQVGQSLELVLQEAVICDARREQMEEAEDIEEPQKYAFREKNSE
ncbi:unnamed protein product [Larinioides sclopetarius]